MNSDYLILIAFGIIGIIILLLISPVQFKRAEFWLKINIVFVFVMIILGIIGLLLVIIDLL